MSYRRDGIGCVSSVDARCSTARSSERSLGRVRNRNKKKKDTEKTKVIRICTISNCHNEISRRRIFANIVQLRETERTEINSEEPRKEEEKKREKEKRKNGILIKTLRGGKK